jgi:hypothetical protein
MLPNYTVEEQRALSEKAVLARKLVVEEGTRLYQQHHPEDNNWVRLANERGLKLTQGYVAPTANKLRKFAEQLGLASGTWEEGFFGIAYKNNLGKAIEAHNARLPEGKKESLRIMQGYLLEQVL